AYFHDTGFFKRVTFFSSTFQDVAAFSTAFNGAVDFRLAMFGRVTSFNESSFADQVRFSASKERRTFPDGSSVRFEFATFAKPELASFHTMALRPGWFINVDARKFDFTSVDWINPSTEELQTLTGRIESASNRLFEKACNQLAVNAEENQRYEESSRLRYIAMEARRLGRARGLACWRLDWWYWAASGYGERAGRGLIVLAVIWLLFAGLYTQVGFARWKPELKTENDVTAAVPDRVGAPLPLTSGLIYSLGVMSLQRPEPSPATPTCYTLIAIETILGPVQAALVALAIRRKFMR
ncbi:MAG TPA: pentapeptide repeat-containing protein, partial [Blastocatellia bacterium]|nr:pentapeptide repeat-containing protein [Blastocatellia bacterium]